MRTLIRTILLFAVLTATVLGDTNPLPRPLPAPVNSPSDEFAPSLSGDGLRLVFSSKRSGSRYPDIYICERSSTSESWPTPVALQAVNSAYSDETPYLTPAGDLLFFSSDRDGSLEMPADSRGAVRVSFDIYISRLESGAWSSPVPLPPGINSPHHERAPTFDPDSRRLFYSRWPFGDFESSQMWSVEISADHFGEPEALPAAINSGHQEASLVPDGQGQGYYFVSRRPGGLGGSDVYHVLYQDGQFGTPRNLGAPMNSASDETGPSFGGGSIYFASDRAGGLGHYDVYVIEPSRTATVEVRDRETGEQIAATVRILEGNGQERTMQFSPGETLALDLITAGPVEIRASAGGYIPGARELNGAGLDPDVPVVIELSRLTGNSVFNVHSIHFNPASAEIIPESIPVLDDLVTFLKEHPELRLEITGHTDLHGEDAYNFRLSLRRAAAVRDYFVSRGLASTRFTVRGAGKTEPLADGIGPGFDEQNRRTEFRILPPDQP